MILPPFDQGQPLFRGNLHGHSTHSDGKKEPKDVAEAYIKAGYDFTCLSDHLWHKTSFSAETVLDVSSIDIDNFLTIPSAELHCYGKKYDEGGLWHLLANGLPLDFAPAAKEETAPELVTRAIEAGAYVTIAHPEWYGLTNEEALSVSHAHAVEIYNHSCHLTAARGYGTAVADGLLNDGYRPGFVATDDSHFNKIDYAGGWVYVAADELNTHSIISALKAKRHYSSTGATFNIIALEEMTLMIECNPVSIIAVNGHGNIALHHRGDNITYAEFDLSNFKSDYFRITIADNSGNMAWTNPYFFDELKSHKTGI